MLALIYPVAKAFSYLTIELSKYNLEKNLYEFYEIESIVRCFFLTPEGSTGSGSGFKATQKTGQRLNVSSDRLGEAGNRTCDPWFTRHRFISMHHGGFSFFINMKVSLFPKDLYFKLYIYIFTEVVIV